MDDGEKLLRQLFRRFCPTIVSRCGKVEIGKFSSLDRKRRNDCSKKKKRSKEKGKEVRSE